MTEEAVVNGAGKPNDKRTAPESFGEDGDAASPVKKLLLTFNHAINNRLDTIERNLENITDFCRSLDEQVDVLASLVRENCSHTIFRILTCYSCHHFRTTASPGGVSSSDENSMSGSTLPIGSNVTLITLNSESDYPNGSWLGDENNPQMRIRCHISPKDLFHINTTCTTPEKMALTLMDYLFDRETQAVSNISGAGKHKKQQLDPLLIYGIRCHLIEKFNITLSDWHRIKQNMDSKCRTAFRRKMKGLPLAPRGTAAGQQPRGAYSENVDCEPVMTMSSEGDVSDGGSVDFSGQRSEYQASFSIQPMSEISSDCAIDVATVVEGTQVIQTSNGEIQVLQATPEHLAQMQQTHQIQVLAEGHFLATPFEEDNSLKDTEKATGADGTPNEAADSTNGT